jgi:hypothetical protein
MVYRVAAKCSLDRPDRVSDGNRVGGQAPAVSIPCCWSLVAISIDSGDYA